jgi:hypothetical protein
MIFGIPRSRDDHKPQFYHLFIAQKNGKRWTKRQQFYSDCGCWCQIPSDHNQFLRGIETINGLVFTGKLKPENPIFTGKIDGFV